MTPPFTTTLVEPIGLWLADFYLAATILLASGAAIFAVIKQPARRMAVAWGTLLGLLVVAVLCQSASRPRLELLPFLLNDFGQAAQIETDHTPLPPVPISAESAPAQVTPPERFEPQQVSVVESGEIILPPLAPAAGEPSRAVRVRLVLAGVVLSFLIGTLLIGTWLSVGVLRASRLVRQSVPASPTCLDELRRIVGPAARAPRLRISRRLLTPVATGALWPAILLPEEFARTDRPRELKAVLAHEWAHIQNGDLWLLALDRIVLALLWAHPLYWWMRRRVRTDQEFLADAAAASGMGAADYAALLVEWARQVAGQRSLSASTAVGLWERPCGLGQRVAALLNRSDRMSVRTSGRTRIGVAAAMAMISLFAAAISLRPPRGGLAVAQNQPQPSDRSRAAGALRANATAPPGVNDISGTCRDKDGKPLADVQVSLYAIQDATGRQQLLRQLTSDSRGRFAFPPCLPRRLVLSSWSICDEDGAGFVLFARRPGLATGVKILTEKGQTIDFTLDKAVSLTGTVRDRQGRPIVGAWLHDAYFPFPKQEWRAARSDAQGNFAITDLAEYKYSGVEGSGPPLGLLIVDRPGFGIAEVSYKRVPGRVDVVLGKGAAIEGTVVYGDTGKPATGIRVIANWIDEPYPYIGINLHDGTTDKNGRYHVGSLPQGRFNLYAVLDPPGRVLLDGPDKGLTTTTVDSFQTHEGRTAAAPPIRLVKGGLVKGMLVQYRPGVNGVTDPVRLEKGETVQIIVFRGPALPAPGVVADLAFVKRDGTFQIRLPSGLHYLSIPNQPKGDGTYHLPYCDMQEPWTVEDAAEPQMPGLHRVKIREGETAEIEASVYRPLPPQTKAHDAKTQNDKSRLGHPEAAKQR